MIRGKFFTQKTLQKNVEDWGIMGRISDPQVTGAKDLVVLDVELQPGKGHSFHKHPRQEEVLYVLHGNIEQWVDGEKRILHPGDSAFVAADVVHASFNVGDDNARILAILGPCVGEEGYEVVDAEGER